MPIIQAYIDQIKNNDPTFTFLHVAGTFPPVNKKDIERVVNAAKKSNNQYLKMLLLGENEIGDEGVELLSELKAIETLVLPDNKITDKSIKYLLKMPNLKSLDISDNLITDNGFKELMNHPTLQELVIVDNNGITSEGVRAAVKNQLLTTLIIKNDTIDAETVEKIQRYPKEDNEPITAPNEVKSMPLDNHSIFSPSSEQKTEEIESEESSHTHSRKRKNLSS